MESEQTASRKAVNPVAEEIAAQQQKQTGRQRHSESPLLLQWQRRLLPFMMGVMTLTAAAFFLFSGIHVYEVTQFIKAAEVPAVHDQIQAEIDKSSPKQGVTGQEVVTHAMLLLEADTVDKRYHQAGGLLMSRIWSRQLAFITGMVMAFVGAAFILGKLSEDLTQISGQGSEWKVAITSASPGIILSFFGTVIIVSSLFGSAKLDVNDGAVYVQALKSPATETVAQDHKDEKPLSLEEMNRINSHRRNKNVSKIKQKP